MSSEKENIRLSKFLSLVLRHQPETIGIVLDENGWTDVQILIGKLNAHGNQIDFETLKYIVDTNSKQRFAFDASFKKIRASQGHSVEIELGYSTMQPPEILYHGTAISAVESILMSGLEKRSRQHVHLSADRETAIKVGKRHGKPVVFEVLAYELFIKGSDFFISDNGVWLTDHVPPEFLRKLK